MRSAADGSALKSAIAASPFAEILLRGANLFVADQALAPDVGQRRIGIPGNEATALSGLSVVLMPFRRRRYYRRMSAARAAIWTWHFIHHACAPARCQATLLPVQPPSGVRHGPSQVQARQ